MRIRVAAFNRSFTSPRIQSLSKRQAPSCLPFGNGWHETRRDESTRAHYVLRALGSRARRRLSNACHNVVSQWAAMISQLIRRAVVTVWIRTERCRCRAADTRELSASSLAALSVLCACSRWRWSCRGGSCATVRCSSWRCRRATRRRCERSRCPTRAPRRPSAHWAAASTRVSRSSDATTSTSSSSTILYWYSCIVLHHYSYVKCTCTVLFRRRRAHFRLLYNVQCTLALKRLIPRRSFILIKSIILQNEYEYVCCLFLLSAVISRVGEVLIVLL